MGICCPKSLSENELRANALPRPGAIKNTLPTIVDSIDSLIVQRSDFIYKSDQEFVRLYNLHEKLAEFESTSFESYRGCRIDCEEKSRVILCHSTPLNLSYHEIRRYLDHPHIGKSFEYYENDLTTYVVCEKYDGGELFDYIATKKTLVEEEAAYIMRQLLLAVNFLHQNQICVRSISPENILFATKDFDAPIKLVGFSKASFCKTGAKLTDVCGVPFYMAPDVLKGEYGIECDIWSCGVLLYVMLSGYPPFTAANDKMLMKKILQGRYDFNGEEWDKVSEKAKNFVRRLLEYDPIKRPTALEALSDPWIQQFKFAPPEKQIDMVFENIKRFKPKNKLQELIWFFITDSVVEESLKKDLPKFFEAFDFSNDGKISREDLLMRYDLPTVEAVMKNVDINRSGYIEYSEFVAATLDRNEVLTKERITCAFKPLDVNRDGRINFADLKATFKHSDERLATEKVWDQLILLADHDNDGLLSLDDILAVMSNMS